MSKRIVRNFIIAGRDPVSRGAIQVPADAVRRLLQRKPLDHAAEGCWLRDPRTGLRSVYCNVAWKDESGCIVAIGAHRLSYLLHKGPIPSGLLVLHTCNNKSCWNPGHLYAGTDLDNQADRQTWERVEAAAGRVTRTAAWRAAQIAGAARRRAIQCEAVAA